MKQGSTTIAFSYFVGKIDFVMPWPQNRVYKLTAQIARLTTLCIEFSIKIPTMWYIATLVPLGVQRILFLPGSSKGLIGQFVLDLVGNPNCWFSHAKTQLFGLMTVISPSKP